MDEVIIAGRLLKLIPMTKSELKGVFIDAVLGYSFYKAEFNSNSFYLLIPKRKGKLAPLMYKQLAARLERILVQPVVFLFDALEYYERNRLIDSGIYFIVSNKYAYLPYLIINAKQSSRKQIEKLQPAAQYLLLYHLQVKNIQGLTISEIEKLVPYKYVTLTRAVTCLEQLNLCRVEKNTDRQKLIYFDDTFPALWEKAQSYLDSPIYKICYCDSVQRTDFAVCGINALAHYTNINSEPSIMYAIDGKSFKELDAKNIFEGINPIEGAVKIEIWKYPAIGLGAERAFVDKLSLYLTLKNDKDPRVEKELEIMIKKIWL